jgi:hypothetical protein
MSYFRSSGRIRQALLASWGRGPCVAPWWPGAVSRCGAAGPDGDVAGVEPAGNKEYRAVRSAMAVAILRGEGLVVTIGGRGTFVRHKGE